MNKKPLKFTDNSPIDIADSLDDFQVSSATECTGLIFQAPQDESELESYEEMYCYEAPFAERMKK